MAESKAGKYEVTINSDSGKEVGHLLMQFVNAYGFDKQGFVEEVMQSHRTCQQALFGLMLECCKAWAESRKNGYFDARNEYTTQKATEIMKLVNDFTRVPCI